MQTSVRYSLDKNICSCYDEFNEGGIYMNKIIENWLLIVFFIGVIVLSIHEKNRYYQIEEVIDSDLIYYTIVEDKIDYSLKYD